MDLQRRREALLELEELRVAIGRARLAARNLPVRVRLELDEQRRRIAVDRDHNASLGEGHEHGGRRDRVRQQRYGGCRREHDRAERDRAKPHSAWSCQCRGAPDSWPAVCASSVFSSATAAGAEIKSKRGEPERAASTWLLASAVRPSAFAIAAA